MPGSVVAASSAVVMPLSYSRSFVHDREWHVLESEYAMGESQRRVIPATSRKGWKLAKPLTSAQYAALLSFYAGIGGPFAPFLFYDGMETTPKWSWDVTGASTVGRYVVRFENTLWLASLNIPRHDVDIRIREVS
jgi:hypothetical protein